MTAEYHQTAYAERDANGQPLIYPGPDGVTAYRDGYPLDSWMEVHEHASLAGGGRVTHSHSDTMATHDGYGPALLTIDRDEWARATGLRGGGRKRYTRRPSGPQLSRCKTGRHRYRRIPLPESRAVYDDGSSITPTAEVCARCGAHKRGSFDF